MVMASSETKFHVLAVDDTLIDRKLIEKLLKTSSYQGSFLVSQHAFLFYLTGFVLVLIWVVFAVTAVDSGTKALEFLGLNNNDHRDVEVNLIITDYCMPGMTGYDLLRKIKESSSFKDIPVVIMSSDNIPSRINRFGLLKTCNFIKVGFINFFSWHEILLKSDALKMELKSSFWSRFNYQMWTSLGLIWWKEECKQM